MMLINGKGTELKNRMMLFKEFSSKNTNARGKEILNLFFNTDSIKNSSGENISWVDSKFYYIPLIKVLVDLNRIILYIRIYESETMEYLQFMGSKEIMTVKKVEGIEKK